jgi:hypothetical protein
MVVGWRMSRISPSGGGPSSALDFEEDDNSPFTVTGDPATINIAGDYDVLVVRPLRGYHDFIEVDGITETAYSQGNSNGTSTSQAREFSLNASLAFFSEFEFSLIDGETRVRLDVAGGAGADSIKHGRIDNGGVPISSLTFSGHDDLKCRVWGADLL